MSGKIMVRGDSRFRTAPKWRRGQVAKAADCKSAIAGSNPADASCPSLQDDTMVPGSVGRWIVAGSADRSPGLFLSRPAGVVRSKIEPIFRGRFE